MRNDGNLLSKTPKESVDKEHLLQPRRLLPYYFESHLLIQGNKKCKQCKQLYRKIQQRQFEQLKQLQLEQLKQCKVYEATDSD